MPAVYEKMGIRFLYPENWTLDETEAISGNGAVSVYSPGGGFWTVALHGIEADPDELAAAALKTLEAEYRDAEVEPVSETMGDTLMSGYDVSFFYLDFLNTALIRGFRLPSASFLILCQAEDREFDEIGPVFRAMTTSLLAQHAAS